MKFLKCLAVVLSFQFSFFAAAFANEENVLYQVSTIDALLGGVLEGDVDFKTLKKKGDFGIGTFNGLDGEMLAFDGDFYQVKSDGAVIQAADHLKTPFCSVVFFNQTKKIHLKAPSVFQDLSRTLDPLLPSENLIYALRIDGVFEYIKTRSVPRQEKPYPKLTEVVKTQPVFEFENVRGTLIGFRFPNYMKGLNVPGYHFHFLKEDREGGGHVLDWKIGGVDIKIAEISTFHMAIPREDEFYKMDFSADKSADLAKVELNGTRSSETGTANEQQLK